MAEPAQKPQSETPPEISTVTLDYARGKPIPWRLKMWAKIILALLPVPYSFWSAIGIFRHGDIDQKLGNLHKGFKKHLLAFREQTGKSPKNILELGPGDSIGHALSAKASGADGMWLIDAGDFARKDEDHYRDFYAWLQDEEKISFDQKPEKFDRESVLKYTNSHYDTRGLESLLMMPDDHIDLSFSNAVLEHIHRDEFAATMQELFRTHRSGSLSRHLVDLHDHLGGALNSFRFSPKFWESKIVKGAGFYTNRLTMNEMISMAEDAGFKVTTPKIIKWEALPTPRDKMHASFQSTSEDELNVCTFVMVLEKP